ncbi:GH24841 [Drosophila grimshawi]|uniref:GH24841 n=1 Tax=Drosophila grimshawi TaxID=7222 RepID=B4JNL3_DROGR|nr:GH24841 [Drosophila grimshawi]
MRRRCKREELSRETSKDGAEVWVELRGRKSQREETEIERETQMQTHVDVAVEQGSQGEHPSANGESRQPEQELNDLIRIPELGLELELKLGLGLGQGVGLGLGVGVAAAASYQ